MHRALEERFVATQHLWIVPLLIVAAAGLVGLVDAASPGPVSGSGLAVRAALYAGLAVTCGAWVAFRVRRVRPERMPDASVPAATKAPEAPPSQPQPASVVFDPAICAHCSVRQQNIALLRANNQLQELDQLRSDLVSMVSHDLRAPLTNISGSLELMDDGCGNPTCNCQTLVPIISQQTSRLTRLVHGLLNVTRIEAGRLQIHRKPILISALAGQAVTSVQATADGHRFELRIPEALPLVWGDEDRLEEVLVNLLDNAIKYSPDGGTIVVGAEPQPGEVVVSVTDPGMGIPEDELQAIFEKYQRSNGSGRANGYGLGLYICQKLVEAHGGRIWAESSPGRGSTFRFSLPAGVPASRPAA